VNKSDTDLDSFLPIKRGNFFFATIHSAVVYHSSIDICTTIIPFLSQYLTNLMRKICFTISFISCLYMFRAHVLETCRNMKWNLLWNKCCSSSWLNTEINILRCTVSKMSKFPLIPSTTTNLTSFVNIYSARFSLADRPQEFKHMALNQILGRF